MYPSLPEGLGLTEKSNTEMCAGAKFRARGAPAKTRYSGHYFSRLMRGASQHVQTECPDYYMGNGQSNTRSP